MTIPGLFALDLLGLLLSPLLFFVAFCADLVVGLRRKRFLRLTAFVLAGLAIETAGVVASFGLWFIGGCGLFNNTRWYQHLLCRLQVWWGTALLDGTAAILKTGYDIEGLELLNDGPIIVLSRHISHGDALIPSYVVGDKAGFDLRHVLKKELTWGPAIDLVGHRQRNHFVSRASASRRELTEIAAMSSGMGNKEASVIFPEGTFFSAERKERVVKRLSKRDPELAERAVKMQHMLPPRPNGTLALLEGAPNADLVFITHVGFEPFSSIANIVRNVPFDRPVAVKIWRVDRSEVPTDPGACVRFLFDWWQELDNWVNLHQR